MARKPRCIVPGRLTEITARTLGARFLLKPSEEVKQILAGILARYARIHEMPIVYWVGLSNHEHGLVIPEDAGHLAAFMRDVQGQIAKELGLHYEWHQRLWQRRYDPLPVAEDEETEVERLAYCLSQGVKEDLVERVADWPGLHAAHQILAGEPIRGVWRDRTREGRQSRCGKRLDPSQYLFSEELVLTKLPCWSHLSDDEYRERVAAMVSELEEEAARKRAAEGKSVLGVQRILAQDPFDAPKSSACSPRPWFHAVSKEAREEMRKAFKAFFEAFYLASAEFLEGKLDVICGGRDPGCPGPPAQIPACGFPALGSCLRS